MHRTNISPNDFIDLIHDEAETLRDMMDGYYNIETGQTENFEKRIGQITGTRRNRWLRTLHAPFNRMGVKFSSDDERHYVMAYIFGEMVIHSADEISNIQAWAWSRCCTMYNEKFALALIKEAQDAYAVDSATV